MVNLNFDWDRRTNMQWRLAAFDFDGSLTQDEMIVRLAAVKGVEEEVASITERAMAGELAYGESLRQRVALIAGLDFDSAMDAIDAIELFPGARTTIESIRAVDMHVAILTGGFSRGVAHLLERDGIEVDTVIANELVVEDGVFTGEVSGPLVDTDKDVVLDELVDSLGWDPSEVVAIGDGANDIPMLEYAGLAVGFRPKPAVRPYCDIEIDTLEGLLSALDIAPRGPA